MPTPAPLAFLAVASLLLVEAAPVAPLRVVRTTPVGEAHPREVITVMFDRPVAGSLEQAVDPSQVLRIEPAVAGRFEWRDPVTLRFIPSAPIARGTRLRLTVDTTFAAMDGTRLAAPHEFVIRIHGPRLLQWAPGGSGAVALHVARDQRFSLAYSESVDGARFEAAARLTFPATCATEPIALRVVEQRPIVEADGYAFREAGGWQRDRSLDSARRVVVVAPRRPLPYDCAGELLAPAEVADGAPAPRRIPLRTLGPLRLTTAQCGWAAVCPTGPVRLTFSSPVRGAAVARHVRLIPETPFQVHDTSEVSTTWTLDGALRPRTAYAAVADSGLRDVFGQRLTGNPAASVRTTGFARTASYPQGRILVERVGFRTLAVEHVNADTLVVDVAPVPDSLEATFLSRSAWGLGDLWTRVSGAATTSRLATRAGEDKASVTGVRMPVVDARTGSPTVFAVRARPTGGNDAGQGPLGGLSLIQVTDLGVTARVGTDQATVWVTGVSDGRPRGGARVELRAPDGSVRATGRSDSTGIARLSAFAEPAAGAADAAASRGSMSEGYVVVTLDADRAVVPINRYDPDLAPWNFGVSEAWESKRLPVAAALFTERGIYRPGEEVIAKAIVRDGPLGALRTPTASDSVRWAFLGREGEPLQSRTVQLSGFGTAESRLTIPATAAVGTYQVAVAVRRDGRWQSVAETSYRVAEFRPPEFLVDMATTTPASLPGERLGVGVRARYLFGAPMAGAAFNWEARRTPLAPWELELPGLAEWTVGRNVWRWYDEDAPMEGYGLIASGIDTLDATGARTITVTLPTETSGATSRVTVAGAVTDVNRQVVGTVLTSLAHPASFYVAVRPANTGWFWREAQAESISVRTVRPDGTAAPGVTVRGTLLRREWHQVRRERAGAAQLVGEWVTDTVQRCTVRTDSAGMGGCTLTPTGGGVHEVEFAAEDEVGRAVATSFSRWVSGRGFVPWSDETQFKMELLADRERYSPGDTATILIAAPFTDVEAWLTVERERVLETRRIRLADGAMTVRVPITEAHAPNVYVSVVAVRGRSAAPSAVDDPGRPTMRVGYVELRVTPEVKRLQVAVRPLAASYGPGDSARARVVVTDRAGRGARSEVTLWAVDEGVLALTKYRTPDPIDLLYARRALGQRLASNLVAVAPQVPEGEKGFREAGGGGGGLDAEIMRSRFRSTAFFLGSVVTDSAGVAEVAAKLPDNLTTFRLMAVAVTAGDRYGSGDAPLLVTRELVARPALPRFVRPGDEMLAGTILNRRDGEAAPARVRAQVAGAELVGSAERTVTVAAGRGVDVRFRLRATDGDSARLSFDASSGRARDAVRVALPIRAAHHPETQVISGALRDSAEVAFELPADVDPSKSRLTLSITTSPLAVLRGAVRAVRVYPYECSEQLVSGSTALLALLRVPAALPDAQRELALRDLGMAVTTLLRRQRSDGGIGYWSAVDWTTPWLSAYVGQILLDARDVGVAVDSAALGRLGGYLRSSLRGAGAFMRVPVASYYDSRAVRLADQVAAADFLSRVGAPDLAAENELLRMTAQMAREDRARLALVLLRRGAGAEARQLVAPMWDQLVVEGRRVALPRDSAAGRFYFPSATREMSRLLRATLRLEPAHPMIAGMVETVTGQGRAAANRRWNTQDLAAAVLALSEFEVAARAERPRALRIRSGRHLLVTGAAAGDTTLALNGLLGAAENDVRALRLQLATDGGDTPVFYHLSVELVPLAPPVRPALRGLLVERWYERFSDGTPVTSVAEGEIVRVRVRLTVTAERQFVVLDDPLPAGLEAIDLSLRTVVPPGRGGASTAGGGGEEGDEDGQQGGAWGHGSWDSGWWTPWEHREIRDDRVRFSAVMLWPGTYMATYLARATTVGTFITPPAHAEEMYNPALYGRSAGGRFTVTPVTAERP